MHSTELMFVTILAWSLNEATTIYKEVFINETTTISCIPNEDIQIQWHHTATNGAETYVYAGGGFYVPSDKGFHLEKDSNTGPYHLVIPKARAEDAGLYECKEDTGSRLFGSTQLTVLESSPSCGLDMESQGYVGPSTCMLEPEDMTFTCALRFNGKPPQMAWTTLYDSQPFEESTCKTETNRITCSLITRADLKYDESTFNCHSTRSTAECSTQIIKIQYFERQRSVVEKSIGDRVNCSVKSNQKLQLRWTLLQDDKHVFLTKDHELVIQNPGLHRCVVEYRIRNVACDALVIDVNAYNHNTTLCEPPEVTVVTAGTAHTAAIIVLSIIVVIIGVATVVLVCRIRKMRLSRHSQPPKPPLASLEGRDVHCSGESTTEPHML